MDEFTPYPSYNPEDEYAPIEPENTQEPAPRPQPAPQPEPQQDIVQPAVRQPEPQPAAPRPAAPQYPAPDHTGYPPQQVVPQQAASQHVAPLLAYQQGYPQGYGQPPVQQPVYPQPPYVYQPQQYSQPVRQYGQPAQPVYPRQGQQAPYPQQGYVQRPDQQPAASQYAVPQQVVSQQAAPGTPANPYQQGYPQGQPAAPVYVQPRPQKTPTSTGTKVFLIVLVALLTAMLVGFGIYIAHAAKPAERNNSGGSVIGDENPRDGGDGDSQNGFNFGDFFSDYGSDQSGDYQEIEDEITLVEDNGETQSRSTDNKASIGKPDENVPALKLEALPADKDEAKYNTNSAYSAVSDSIVTVECFLDEITDNDRDIAGSGSGTIISADGYIITNAHVISNSKELLVRVLLNNGKKYQAKIVGYDTWTDLAVLKIDAKNLKPVTFGDSKLINVGDDVIAIGSPGGEKFQNSLTKGIVSAVDRELSINRYVRYIQSDAAISPGNSGGALCNIYGQVIGITTAKTVATYYENMSFSIPSETVKEIVDDLMHYGYVKGRCRIGLMGTEVSQEEIYYYGTQPGIMISGIDENGSLADSDLQEGDILVELDGVEITSFQDVYDVLADHKPGDKITLKAVRPEE